MNRGKNAALHQTFPQYYIVAENTAKMLTISEELMSD